MLSLTAKQVKHVAVLAKLDLSEKEVEKFRGHLSEIIDYIKQLEEVETGDTLPTSQTTGLENNTREDKTDPAGRLTKEEALSGSDNTHNGYFVVKMVLENLD
jgi:aspartyl-tRNA(Asn)/glutamyl-tRNA(Gln) amidotransferase subunit C